MCCEWAWVTCCIYERQLLHGAGHCDPDRLIPIPRMFKMEPIKKYSLRVAEINQIRHGGNKGMLHPREGLRGSREDSVSNRFYGRRPLDEPTEPASFEIVKLLIEQVQHHFLTRTIEAPDATLYWNGGLTIHVYWNLRWLSYSCLLGWCIFEILGSNGCCRLLQHWMLSMLQYLSAVALF